MNDIPECPFSESYVRVEPNREPGDIGMNVGFFLEHSCSSQVYLLNF